MAYDIEAVFKCYPNAAYVHEINGAEDIDGNPIELDEALLASVQDEVNRDRAFARLRRLRKRYLEETDWAALSDVTMTDEMRAYRQALRDLPANTTDPTNPVWPEKPAS